MPLRAQPDTVSREPVVLIVDDDALVRDSLQMLFRSVGLQSEAFDSTAALLAREFPDAESCLILDVRLPGLNGLDFQAQLAKSARQVPVILMTGYGDIPMSVRAMKAGAVDFLAKPFRDQDMLDAVAVALHRDRAARRERQELASVQACFDTLTAREREVMGWVTTGLLNKQIAAKVGLSEVTVKIHRGSLMRKMRMRSVADLVKASELLHAHEAS